MTGQVRSLSTACAGCMRGGELVRVETFAARCHPAAKFVAVKRGYTCRAMSFNEQGTYTITVTVIG
jgi:hypothetical protein